MVSFYGVSDCRSPPAGFVSEMSCRSLKLSHAAAVSICLETSICARRATEEALDEGCQSGVCLGLGCAIGADVPTDLVNISLP